MARRDGMPRLLGSAINPAETDAGALIRLLKPMLMGKDPLAREDLHAAMRARQRSAGLRVIDACDTALWDIGAKAAGVPLYKFLGGGRAHDCAGTSEGRPMETPRATVECADLARAFVFQRYLQ